MYFRYSQIRSEIAFTTHNMKALFMIRELTIKTCLHFRPVAVMLN